MTDEIATAAHAGFSERSTVQEAEARRLRIQAGLEQLDTDITDAYLRRDWQTLGYGSWERYAEENLVSARLRLPREQRRELVEALRDAGMSTRAIASATGNSDKTVRTDLDQVRQITAPGSGQSVVGMDGKSYRSAKEPQDAPVEAEVVEETPAEPEPAPSRKPRTDVPAAINRMLSSAADAADAADEIDRAPLRARADQAASWSRRLEKHLTKLQRLHTLLQEVQS